MHVLARLVILIAVFLAAGITLSAQWREVVTRVPLTASGEPDLAALPPRLMDGRPDFSGVWSAEKEPCTEKIARLGCLDAIEGIPRAAINIAGGTIELPMQPWAEALFKERRAAAGKEDSVARCLPLASPRAWSNFALQKIVHTPAGITILDEYMLQYRQIFTDGRTLPADPEPTFKGYSVGRWDGDTLVVETIGFRDGLWLDMMGHPLTDQARTIERIRRPNIGTLEVELTVNDPKAYTKPWTTTIKLTAALNTDLLEYVCNENEKSLQHMVGPAVSR